MIQHDLAGVLVLAATDDMTAAYAQAQFRVPVELSIDEDATGGPDSQIVGALDSLIEHLAGLGHRRVAHIAGDAKWSAARTREAAYAAAVARHGMESLATIPGDWSSASGYAAVARIPEGVTAIVASNDQMALGAMLALEERGIRVPDDMSVTGIDDIPEAAFLRPPLSTIRLDFMAQGEGAFMRLLRRIDPARAVEPRPPAAVFVSRASTGPAPGAR